MQELMAMVWPEKRQVCFFHKYYPWGFQKKGGMAIYLMVFLGPPYIHVVYENNMKPASFCGHRISISTRTIKCAE